MIRLHTLVVGCLLVCALSAPAAAPDSDYTEVDVQDLIDNPQNYWALGIVFKDRLLGPPGGRALRIGSQRYYPFSAEQLDICYADPQIVPRMEIVDLDREYIFSGTVLQKSRSYYIVVRDLQPATVGATTLEPLVPKPDTKEDGRRVWDVLQRAEQALFAHAQEHGLDASKLLTPNSPHRQEAIQVLRATVVAAETQYETTSRELLTEFVEMTLIQAMGTAVDEPAPEESVVRVIDSTPAPMDRVPDVAPDKASPPPNLSSLNAPVVWEEERPVEETPPEPSYKLKLLPYNATVLQSEEMVEETIIEEEVLLLEPEAEPASDSEPSDVEIEEVFIEDLPIEEHIEEAVHVTSPDAQEDVPADESFDAPMGW